MSFLPSIFFLFNNQDFTCDACKKEIGESIENNPLVNEERVSVVGWNSELGARRSKFKFQLCSYLQICIVCLPERKAICLPSIEGIQRKDSNKRTFLESHNLVGITKQL